jgi:protein SCO1/2
MKQMSTTRLVILAGTLLLLVGSAFAMQLSGDIPKANNVASNTKIDLLNQVGIEPQMGKPIPLDLRFKDESGKSVMLRDYFNNGRPVLIAPVYFSCTMLCNQALNGMMSSLNVLKFSAGSEFDVLAVSFDPRETPDLAMEKRQMYMDRYKRAGAEKGIHFLIGDDANIKPLMKSIGFKYAWDERSSQYAHASALILVTPEGKVAQYYYGIEYSPKDMRLGIIEASQEKIGNLMDQVILYCFHYDPSTGKYGATTMSAMRISGVITVMMICGFIFISLRRERHSGPLTPAGRA